MPSTRACLANTPHRLPGTGRTCIPLCIVLGHALTSANRKQEGTHRGAQTPFDCCSLSFQPFEHPVVARNADGTGNVFDLTNIIPWLKYACVYEVQSIFLTRSVL